MSPSTLRIFVLNVPEFASLTEAARRLPACRLSDLGDYTVIASDEPVEFGRRALGLKPARLVRPFHRRARRQDRTVSTATSCASCRAMPRWHECRRPS
ncbi:hypothetical protein ACTMU2_26410 [Cupriavidus basilensis]